MDTERADRAIATLIVTHGGLARELLAAAATIAGGIPESLSALALDWADELGTARDKIRRRVVELDRGAGVLILTDMHGDTPSNAALTLQEPGRVEVVSGVNLPMVVRLACTARHAMSVSELASWIQDKGRGSISRLAAGEPRTVSG